MKKPIYTTPTVEVIAVDAVRLLQGSGNDGVNIDVSEGEDPPIFKEPSIDGNPDDIDAKENSVWDIKW